jgi:class 3 adenylate cyclase
MKTQPVVVVVDDDSDVRDMMVEYLSGAGFAVLEAVDSVQMLQHLEQSPVDLVLLDRTMPGGDSLRLIPDLRRRWPLLGIIVVTALGQDEERIRGLDVGADDYVTKPFIWRELTARIHAVLRRVRTDDRRSSEQPTETVDNPVTRRSRRRLAAILFADVEGFTRLMQDDEAATLRALRRLTDSVIVPEILAQAGRMVKTLGDGFIAEFPTAQRAVDCALTMQRHLERRNARLAEHSRLRFRIGIHLARVVVTGDGDVYGDGVNLASRLQSAAAPGAIVVSEAVRDACDAEHEATFIDLGARTVKNVTHPVRMFEARSRRRRSGTGAPPPQSDQRKFRWERRSTRPLSTAPAAV